MIAFATAVAVAVLALWDRPRRVGGWGGRASRGAGRPARVRTRRRPGEGRMPSVEVPPDEAVLFDLVATALAAGVAVPVALDAVGEAVGSAEGAALRRGAARLVLGAGWAQVWQDAPSVLDALAAALEPAWTDGVAAEPLLARAAERVRAERSTRAREAAGRLSARLVLPLGLCLLPSFVLLGLVPVVLGTGRGLLG